MNFTINIKNADRQNHEKVTCLGNFFQKLTCRLKNLANLVYKNLFRVKYAEITWNGKKVVDASSFYKLKNPGHTQHMLK